MKNVKKFLKDYLVQSGLMDRFLINTDFHDSEVEHAGLFSNGTSLIDTDITGSSEYQANFMLLSNLQSFNDYDRINNSDFLYDLTYQLDKISNEPIKEKVGDELKDGVITDVKASNAMVYETPTGDINDGVVYHLQIKVNYVIY